MNFKFLILFFLFFITNNHLFGQSKKEDLSVVNDSLKTKKSDDINPLSPAKAAFYSAILPGMGQAYNKKYWKIPLVYGALGTALYFYIDSDNKYNDFRNAYKQRLEGNTTDGLSYLSNDRLLAGQKFYQRNRDLSTIFVVVIYVLNIVDANVDAHLLQFNVNEKLSIKPDLLKSDFDNQRNLAICLKLKL